MGVCVKEVDYVVIRVSLAKVTAWLIDNHMIFKGHGTDT